jgi:tetraacyldisaccharide 4'-kinase
MLKFFLFPFALLYNLVVRVRNFLYDQQFFTVAKFQPFIISVGNLTVGGTGKTPHVEYLLKLLGENNQIATLSRGYGRKTRGVIIANRKRVSPQIIGDEPMQIFSKFGSKITVAVGEKRAEAIPQILAYQPHTEVIVLDDAYQHRAVSRNVNILLTDFYKPFYTDFVLPMGRLRESREGAKRADVVIVTKCPENLQTTEKEIIKRKISQYAMPNTPIFFTGFKYDAIRNLSENRHTANESPPQTSLLLLTGIADTTSLLDYLQEKFEIIKHFAFADHFEYSKDIVNQVIKTFKALNKAKPCAILTTEKDSIKLLAFQDLFVDIPVYYLPIKVYFLENENEFQKIILNFPQ